MMYRLSADLVLRLIWIHVPAVLWGVAIEFIGFVCPLTPLEGWLREQGGEIPMPSFRIRRLARSARHRLRT